MLRLGLIGKNISHSRSPEIYGRLIHEKFSYDLLDYEDEILIPSLEALSEKYDGLNITAPYKKHFLSEVILSEQTKKLNAINCLKFDGGRTFGENTDYLAILKLLPNYLKTKPHIKILGDGAMANVVIHALDELKVNYKQYSRKMSDNFYQLSFNENNILVINCCGRDYLFKGQLTEDSHFWDLNYNSSEQFKLITNTRAKYSDGFELLELQALYAVQFWSAR